MPKKHGRRKDYSRAQEKKIKAIKDGPTRTIELQALANQFNRSHQAVYLKWLALNGRIKPYKRKKGVRAIKSARIDIVAKLRDLLTPVPAAAPNKMVPYVLETGAGPMGKNDQTSTRQLKDKLRPAIQAMEPYSDNTPHTVPIHASERTTVRKWLKEDSAFKGRVFSLSPVKNQRGNPTPFVRIYRKT